MQIGIEFIPLATVPRKASAVRVKRCFIGDARDFIFAHHSRLPVTQRGPWKYAFDAVDPETAEVFATALWHNPSARTLPQSWVELRRMAVKNAAPHCMASAFLGKMVTQLRKMGHRHFISYQDAAVHTGTIYKASGWRVEYVGKWRDRQRGFCATRGRNYRTSINGSDADHAPKVRWGLCFNCPEERCRIGRS